MSDDAQTPEGVRPEVAAAVGDWRAYVEAKMGFRNHWYPVRFSNELSEGQLITLQVLGEKLLLKRIDGKVYAIRAVLPDPTARRHLNLMVAGGVSSGD